ncbi:MAG: OadG family protein [Treponema sp.]|jgi:oxaloacetate decarboxylase gamma subunit|nr:OadG family protein [Treponema sp.]
MAIITMFKQSAILTALGMAVVFLFLWIMIVCINLTGKLIHAMGWDKDPRTPQQEGPKKQAGAVSPKIAAAITAALAEYRKGEKES